MSLTCVLCNEPIIGNKGVSQWFDGATTTWWHTDCHKGSCMNCTRLRAEVERKDALLVRARQLVTDNSPSTAYADKDDDSGVFGCCGEATYRGHAPGCWWIELRAALGGGEAG